MVGLKQPLVVLILHCLKKEEEFSSFHGVFGFLKWNNLGNYVRPDIGTKWESKEGHKGRNGNDSPLETINEFCASMDKRT